MSIISRIARDSGFGALAILIGGIIGTIILAMFKPIALLRTALGKR